MVSQIEADVRAAVEHVVVAQGVELYWLELRTEGPRWQVIVYIDRAGGVSIDDCERVSRALEEPLDTLIACSYDLEVSSPGMDRFLYTHAHYKRAVGKPIEVRLRGRQVLTGWLQGIAKEGLILKDEQGQIVQVPLKDVHRAQVVESRFL